nr:MAG TPA: apolipoprotein [Caudoviricetes sp.]
MIDKLRYWCHKILPLVYDDSLSYYEFLCKMNAKLNEVIDSTNGLVEAWEKFQTELEKAWQDYKSALTAEWTDYKAQMDLKYSTLVGTVSTEINAMKTDISTFKNDISTQITEFEAKVDSDYAEFTADIEEKINTFIAKYNAEIAKIPDEITAQVNAWWSSEENYTTLVENVANAIGTTLTSGAVTFSTVSAMTSATAATLPVKTLAVCTNYYNTDGIYTLWVIVSGDVSDGVSRLGIGDGVTVSRTAILLSEKNADTLGLRGAVEAYSRSKLLTMCKNNYKYLKITSNGITMHMPSTADVGSASITPLAIYGTNRAINTTMSLKEGDCNAIKSLSDLTITLTGQGATTMTSDCHLHNVEIIPQTRLTLTHIDIRDSWYRGDGLTLAPTADDKKPVVINNLLSTVINPIKLVTGTNIKGIEFLSNQFWRDSGVPIGVSWAYLDIDGNSSPITLRDNTCRAGSSASASTEMLLANCKNFTETGKVLICEGNRNEVGGASHPQTMLSGDIPSDIVYINNAIRYGSTYAMSTIPTTGTFSPARVMGVTSPIGYLRTGENLTAVHGTPLTLTYPNALYWTSGTGGTISLSSDTSALYKVTFRATVRLSGQESTGNAKITLSGRATDSRTFSVVTGLEYVPISFEFYWGTGGGFTIEASSETENMTLIIREAEVLIERIR